MSTDESPDEHDPFFAHFHREPLPGAGVRIILITEQPEESARSIIAPIVESLSAAGRPVESCIIRFERGKTRLGQALENGVADGGPPLVLITTALEPWAPAPLQPPLAAIGPCAPLPGRGAPGAAGRGLRGGARP